MPVKEGGRERARKKIHRVKKRGSQARGMGEGGETRRGASARN